MDVRTAPGTSPPGTPPRRWNPEGTAWRPVRAARVRTQRLWGWRAGASPVGGPEGDSERAKGRLRRAAGGLGAGGGVTRTGRHGPGARGPRGSVRGVGGSPGAGTGVPGSPGPRSWGDRGGPEPSAFRADAKGAPGKFGVALQRKRELGRAGSPSLGGARGGGVGGWDIFCSPGEVGMWRVGWGAPGGNGQDRDAERQREIRDASAPRGTSFRC